MFEDFHFAEAEVFFVLAIVSDVHELAGVTFVFVAVEKCLLVLKIRAKSELASIHFQAGICFRCLFLDLLERRESKKVFLSQIAFSTASANKLAANWKTVGRERAMLEHSGTWNSHVPRAENKRSKKLSAFSDMRF